MDYGSIIKYVGSRVNACESSSNYYTNIGEWLDW